jgi:uncharacterized RDD family membrane protein YckC
MTTTDGPTGHTYPGRALGLPEDGVGSVASMSRRIGAFVIDIVLSALDAWWMTAPEAPGNTSLSVWAVMTVVTVGLFGITPGQAALGIRVVPLRAGGAFVGLWAIPRTVLIFLIVPPLLLDANGRGLHDRLCRTVVLRIR